MINPAATSPAYDSAGVLFIAMTLAGREYNTNKPQTQADLVAIALEAQSAGYATPAGEAGPACYSLSELARIFRHAGGDPYRFYGHFCEAVAKLN
jgi:hypothetical protein